MISEHPTAYKTYGVDSLAAFGVAVGGECLPQQRVDQVRVRRAVRGGKAYAVVRFRLRNAYVSDLLVVERQENMPETTTAEQRAFSIVTPCEQVKALDVALELRDEKPYRLGGTLWKRTPRTVRATAPAWIPSANFDPFAGYPVNDIIPGAQIVSTEQEIAVPIPGGQSQLRAKRRLGRRFPTLLLTTYRTGLAKPTSESERRTDSIYDRSVVVLPGLTRSSTAFKAVNWQRSKTRGGAIDAFSENKVR